MTQLMPVSAEVLVIQTSTEFLVIPWVCKMKKKLTQCVNKNKEAASSAPPCRDPCLVARMVLSGCKTHESVPVPVSLLTPLNGMGRVENVQGPNLVETYFLALFLQADVGPGPGARG